MAYLNHEQTWDPGLNSLFSKFSLFVGIVVSESQESLSLDGRRLWLHQSAFPKYHLLKTPSSFLGLFRICCGQFIMLHLLGNTDWV